MILKKKLIIFPLLILIIAFLGYQVFSNNKKTSQETFEVKRGDVIQRISETGQVKRGEEIDLSFKEGGEIEKIYVEKGEIIKKGYLLAKLDTKEIRIQLQEAEADKALAEAKLAKLLAGASQEEIALAESEVKTAEISLKNAEQNLADIKAQAENNLKNSYEDALNVMNDSYLVITEAFNTVDLIQRKYFTSTDQESLKVKEQKLKIELAKENAGSWLDTAKSSRKNEDIDVALTEMESSLSIIKESIGIIRETCDSTVYRNTVSQSDKDSLDSEKSSIQSTLTKIIQAQQDIASTLLSNQKSINDAQGKVLLAQGELEKAKRNLEKIKAEPTKEDINLKKAEIKKAEARTSLLREQLESSFLKSPVDGEVIKIYKEEGETVNPAEIVLTVLPSTPFQIKSDIYEEDISKIKISDPVDIEVIAFPGKILKGRVIEISPSEKIIDEVIYYEMTIAFDNPPSFLKPGLTADIVIETGSRKNVLYVPESALIKKDGKVFVKILKGDEVEEREIKTGLVGEEGRIEVISGLKEGEIVILQ